MNLLTGMHPFQKEQNNSFIFQNKQSMIIHMKMKNEI